MLKKSLLCLIAFWLLPCFVTHAASEKRVALVIGNSSYDNATYLDNPVNDAKAVESKLLELGFDVLLSLDADQQSFIETLEEFRERLEGATHAVFYFAGHGIQVDGQNYLISTNASLDSRFKVQSETIALDQIIEVMEGSSPVNMVFLDACRTNPFTERLREVESRSRSATITKGLAPMSRALHDRSGKELLVMFATAPNRLAEDGEGENSPFAKALIQHLGTPSAEVSIALKRVIKDVREATNYRQSPEILSSMSVEFFFNHRLPENASDLTGSSDAIYLAFNAARNSNTSDAWRRFLDQTPDGYYADLARDALVEAEANEYVFDVSVSSEQAENSLALNASERRDVQLVLAALRYDPGPADGAFGKGTRHALQAFQREWGLAPTGYIDKLTQQYLRSERVLTAAGRSLDGSLVLEGRAAEEALGLTLQEKKAILRGLGVLGYDAGASREGLDGYKQRAAIKQFQFKNDKEPTGFLHAEDAAYLLKLGREQGQFVADYLDVNDLDPRSDPRLIKGARIFNNRLVLYAYFGNSLYFVVEGDRSWDSYESLAESAGGHLVVFSSAAEKKFVDDLVSQDTRFYVSDSSWHDGPTVGYFQKGSARSSTEGWRSVTGEPVRFLNWFKGQPNEVRLARKVGFAVYGGEGPFSRNRRLAFADQIRFQQIAQSAVIEVPPEPVKTQTK
ncbi:caspase family protein [Roseibium sp. LAB1]